MRATAEFELYGSVIYIDIIQFEEFNRKIKVEIDGINYGSYEGSDFTVTVAGTCFAPYLIRIPNLEDSEHTVKLTVEYEGGNVYFNWAASSSGKLEKEGPYTFIGSCLRLNAAGYVASNGGDAAVTKYNEVIEDVVRDLSNDGLNVAYVDASAYYNPDTDISGDNLHPNDLGHSHIADAFLSTMNSVSLVRGRGLRAIDWRDTTKNLNTTEGASFAGNVGIGTTSPTHKLNIVGVVNITSNLIVGNNSGQSNITLHSPDGSAWICGVNDSGAFSCS